MQVLTASAICCRLAQPPGADRDATRSRAVGLAFTGSNAWWQPAVYDVLWAAGPVHPTGLPPDSPLLWVGALVAGYGVLAGLAEHQGTARAEPVLVAAPAVLVPADSPRTEPAHTQSG